MNILNWVKSNKILSVLLFIAGVYFFWNSIVVENLGVSSSQKNFYGGSEMMMDTVGVPSMSIGSVGRMNKAESTDVSATNRMVIEDTNFSLLVKDVNATITGIKEKVTGVGGFVISSYVSRPEESASGNISIRVPAKSADEVAEFLRKSAVKVVSENISGVDVTDQYTDLDARLGLLSETKARFEKIYRSTENVDEMLQVQREILNVQQQIDSIVGQKKYLENTSSSVKFTVVLSTDEFSLPYSPEGKWRPDVVFKQSVRALISTLRGFVDWGIRIAVFGVVWIPAVIIVVAARKIYVRRKKTSGSLKI